MIALCAALLLLLGATDEALPDGHEYTLRADPCIVDIWLEATPSPAHADSISVLCVGR